MILLAAAAASLMGLTELPPQAAAPGRCRLFLWARTETPFRIAMGDESAQTIRLTAMTWWPRRAASSTMWRPA